MALIGISGKKQSGKDTVGRIIQYLVQQQKDNNNVLEYTGNSFEDFCTITDEIYLNKYWKVKKFADKLKDIVCLLIGCTREQLEDEEFKNTELGEEWWKYEVYHLGGRAYFATFLEASEYRDNNNRGAGKIIEIKPTPRFLLQNIGTELFRNQLHPNIWVNSLMSNYNPLKKQVYNEINKITLGGYNCKCNICNRNF